MRLKIGETFLCDKRTILYSVSVTYNFEEFSASLFTQAHSLLSNVWAIDTTHPRGAKVITYPVMTSMNSVT